MKLVAACVFASALSIAFPEVNDHTITSPSLPGVELTVAGDFSYAGGRHFTLYGVAEAQQEFFVDSDQGHNVRRFYWFQFERFLPGNDNRYNCPPVRLMDIGGLDFIGDTKVYTDYAAVKPEPESDVARARSLLASKGFRLPRAATRARLIHLVGSDRRSELMIIYAEALPSARLPNDAVNEMPADDRFPQLAEEIIDHAKQSLQIRLASSQANSSPETKTPAQ